MTDQDPPELHHRFRKLTEESTDVIAIVDESGEFSYLTPSAESILGYPPEELVGVNGFDNIHPHDVREVQEKFFDLLDQPGEERAAEYRWHHSDGSWRVLESKARNLLDDDVIEGFVVHTRDVTDRVQQRQRVEVLNRILRHDLRNDMNLLIGYIDQLLGLEPSPTLRDKLQLMEDVCRDLVDLSNEIRDMEQMLSDQSLNRTQIDIVDVIEDHGQQMARQYPEATIQTDLPDESIVYMNELIGSAIDNLIENGIEHNDQEDPVVEISAVESEDEDGFTRVEIADNGPGLPETERKVLEEGEETQLHHSSGLGLWLVNWILTESGGEVVFEENDPRGTIVTLLLPSPPE